MANTTESNEPLMGAEKQWTTSEFEAEVQSRKETLVKTLRSYWPFIDTFLLLIIIGLLLVLRSEWTQSSPSSSDVGGDFTGAGPRLATKVVKFEADMEYAPRNTTAFFTEETLSKWKLLLPNRTGYAPAGEMFFTTSMTHQLHCVYMMARIFSGVMSNMTELLPEDYHDHFLHCIDYVRQGTMCSADLAMEAHDANDSDNLGPLDGGWSGYHVCKDYSEVVSYLDEEISHGVRIVLPIDD